MSYIWPELPTAYNNKDFEQDFRDTWSDYKSNLEDLDSKAIYEGDNAILSNLQIDTVGGGIKSPNGTQALAVDNDGDIDLSGDLDVVGDVTADNFHGDGSGLTGIASGTGGVINTGSTTIGADSNDDDSGVIALQIKGVTKAGVNNDGVFEADEADIDGLADDFVMSGKELLQSKTILDQQVTPYYHFDGASGNILVSDDSSFAELFANGGTYICKFNAFTAGEGDAGRIFNKGNITLRFASASGQIAIIVYFSGDNASWTSDTNLSFDKESICVLCYDGSDVSNQATFYVDGVEVALTQTSIPTGTIDTDAGDLYIGQVRTGDTNTFDGNIYSVIFLNRELTEAEAISFSSNPQKALDWKDEFGSNDSIISGNDSTFDGAGNWTNISCATFNVNNTVAGKAYMLGDGANDVMNLATSIKKGYSYRITLKARLNSGDSIEIYAGQATSSSASSNIAFTPTGVESTFSGEFTAYQDSTLHIGKATTGFAGTAFEIDDVVVTQLGATLVLKGKDAGPVQWKDSANGNHGLVSGATLHNKPVKQEYQDIYKSVADNDTFTIPANAASLQIIFDVITEEAGTAVRIGTANGGEQVVADVATTSAGITTATMVLTDFKAGDTLYIGADGGAAWSALDLNVYVEYKILNVS